MADVGFFTCYNLRRLLNIVGIEAFRSYLLAFLATIAPLLASTEPFCLILNFSARIFPPKISFHISKIFANLAGYYCNKLILNGGY